MIVDGAKILKDLMNAHHMERKRYDELGLQGKKVTCPKCDERFTLFHILTTGGGWGVIGVKCPRCRKQFAIKGGATE